MTAENKTRPTDHSVNIFLESVSSERRTESQELIAMMHEISGEQPVMWGPSIIGFGSVHYRYKTGREGDMPLLGFSPRRGAITVYFSEGFSDYRQELERLGKHTTSVSCLYIKKLTDIDILVLRSMIMRSYDLDRSNWTQTS